MGSVQRVLLIRADASAQIGTGHLMRCLALAQAWKDRGGEGIFITACETEGLHDRLLQEGFQVVNVRKPYPDQDDWAITSQLLAAHVGAWVVIDGYHFDRAYQRQIKEAGHRLLIIDDGMNLDQTFADLVLNQNIHAERLFYRYPTTDQLLLGTRYALLRSEFTNWRIWRRELQSIARHVLITLGGSDPHNVTLKVINVLMRLHESGLQIKIVAGAANPHVDTLRQYICSSKAEFQVLTDVNNMPELMAWADVAVSAGGSTCWEIAFMGLPSLILILADNQQPIAVGLEAEGAALNLGWHSSFSEDDMVSVMDGLIRDPARRRAMSERGRELVDGHGSERVVNILTDEDR